MKVIKEYKHSFYKVLKIENSVRRMTNVCMRFCHTLQISFISKAVERLYSGHLYIADNYFENKL